jgi:voltage-gated potassium channel
MPERSMQERVTNWMMNRERNRGLRPRDAAVIISIIWVISIVLFGVLERIADPSTFHTVWLGMWWALETVTTVGYGDVVPHTVAGKLIGSVLLLGGLAFLTVIIAMITSGFVARYQRQAMDETLSVYEHEMHTLSEQIAALRADLKSDQR